EGKTLIVIDTAGVRKKRHMVTNDIEFYSFHRAQRSVRRADVVLLLIDATEPISEPDKKLAQYVAEQDKPVILVVNKWDLAFKQLVAERMPSFPGGRRPKIYYATMTAVAPPTIIMFVNAPEYVDESYRRFVVNRLRELLPYDEVPIKLEVRGRSGRQNAQGESIDGALKTRPQHRPRGGKLARKSARGPKPHPKKAGRHGPKRGTRPH